MGDPVMKFLIINSFRSLVYIAYLALIGYGAFTGYVNSSILTDEFGISGPLHRILGTAVGVFGGWIVATLIAGLIVMLLDIRDDVNDLLKIAEGED